jgi:AraC family transcriptional regulator, activator of mtrCDE
VIRIRESGKCLESSILDRSSARKRRKAITLDRPVPKSPSKPVAARDLDRVITTLEVDFVRLAECVVSPGWRLCLGASDLPAIHYNLTGSGRMLTEKWPPIPLSPHTLTILPARTAFRIEVDCDSGSTLETVASSQFPPFELGKIRRLAAGNDPRVIMICGYFSASYGTSIDLFARLPVPIMEKFDANDQLDQKLKSALAELVAQEIGSGAMTMALMKQVLVPILRRSLNSTNLWAERFAVLNDPQIARALSDMVARPDAPHSVETLSGTSALSRSAFMLRFTKALGASPMTVLREMRMRQAKVLLAVDSLSIDQIARAVGYANRTSFFRAFRKAHGMDPSDYRANAHSVTDKAS